MKFDNRDYLVVNAFANEPFGGNPAGVFPAAEGLTDLEMQRIARQLNLVETVFVFPADEPDVDRHLRYFTPLKELPVAGHPTIAAWTALCHEGLIDPDHKTEYRQKTAAGIQDIRLQRSGAQVAVTMKQPEARFLSIIEGRESVASVFGLSVNDLVEELPVQVVDTGLGHLVVPVKSLDALMRVERKIEPLRRICEDFDAREAQLFSFDTRDSGHDLHTRNLCPRQGIEDPACGVGNGALGAYLARNKYPQRDEFSFAAEQGHIVDMPSVINVQVFSPGEDLFEIYIGGSGVIMTKGRMFF